MMPVPPLLWTMSPPWMLPSPTHFNYGLNVLWKIHIRWDIIGRMIYLLCQPPYQIWRRRKDVFWCLFLVAFSKPRQHNSNLGKEQLVLIFSFVASSLSHHFLENCPPKMENNQRGHARSHRGCSREELEELEHTVQVILIRLDNLSAQFGQHMELLIEQRTRQQ
jgi:hypothetical protein